MNREVWTEAIKEYYLRSDKIVVYPNIKYPIDPENPEMDTSHAITLNNPFLIYIVRSVQKNNRYIFQNRMDVKKIERDSGWDLQSVSFSDSSANVDIDSIHLPFCFNFLSNDTLIDLTRTEFCSEKNMNLPIRQVNLSDILYNKGRNLAFVYLKAKNNVGGQTISLFDCIVLRKKKRKWNVIYFDQQFQH